MKKEHLVDEVRAALRKKGSITVYRQADIRWELGLCDEYSKTAVKRALGSLVKRGEVSVQRGTVSDNHSSSGITYSIENQKSV